MTKNKELKPTPRILMGPGPSDVHPRVLRAMATPLLGHLDPEYLGIMDEVMAMLRLVFRTENELTFALPAPASAGMEAGLVNLIEPGDDVIICVNGFFGNRMSDIVERCGGNLLRVDAPWGSPIEPEQVRKALENCAAKLVAIVHAETSTGVLQPLDEISQIVHEAGALFLVDAVTSLGGVDVRADERGIDAIYSCSQKCLSAPPGLSPVSFSSKALAVIEGRKSKVNSWFLDLNLLKKYWGEERMYHHTAPISSFYALYEALRIVLEEGLDACFARHQKNHEYLRDGLEKLGFEFIVAPEYRIPHLNAVRIPPGLDDLATRRRLLNEYNIEIGGGLGDFAGKVWRIGLMGCSSSENHVNLLLAALENLINTK